MASVINTNSLSLLTQNNLTKSQSSLSTAIERLSSGLRINSAKDDAAGQAIANRFTANITGLTQASRNANDGISLAQTTEGALTEVNNNLQRIRELAVQAANGSNSGSDLKSIQDEITQRLAEIDRTSAQTDFNGVKVLASNKALSIQVGANDGQTIDINLQKMDTTALGMNGFNVDGSGTANSSAAVKDLKAAGYAAGTVTNGTTEYTKAYGASDAATLSTVFGKIASGDTVTDSVNPTASYKSNGTSFDFSDTARSLAKVRTDLKPAAGGFTTVTVKIGGTSQDAKIDSSGKLTAADDGAVLYLDATGNLSKTNAGSDPQANINGGTGTGDILESMSKTGGTSGVITSGAAKYTLTVATATVAATGLNISSSALSSQLGTSSATTGSTMAITLAGTKYDVKNTAGTVAVTDDVSTLAVNVDMNGALTTNTAAKLYVHDNGTVTDGSSNQVYNDSANADKFTLNKGSGSTATANALSVIDAALSNVDGLRSSLGAVQNRFASTISNLGTTIVNLSSSRSRIEDADYATEVSNMTRAQILQQAGTSVLSQANKTTQSVLSLLQ